MRDLKDRYDYSLNRRRAVLGYTFLNLGLMLASIGLWGYIAYLFVEVLAK